MNNHKICKKIKEVRLDKKLSQYEMATRLHMDERSYRRFENCEKLNLTNDFLERVASELDLDMIELFKIGLEQTPELSITDIKDCNGVGIFYNDVTINCIPSKVEAQLEKLMEELKNALDEKNKVINDLQNLLKENEVLLKKEK